MDVSLPYPDVGSTAGLAALPDHDLMQGEGSGSVLLLPCCDGAEGAKPHLQRNDT